MVTQVKLPAGLPSKMKSLKRDDVGRPIPFFVAYVDGKPDFRTMDARNLRRCLLEDLCWVCGERLPRHQGRRTGVFVAGPMCLVNRTSAEPPSHRECAEWSARACPFLVNPHKVRREANMPAEGVEPAGIMIARNPGVTALIESDRWQPWDAGNGLLIEFRGIRSVEFMARGERATIREVMDSIESGLPRLVEMAEGEPGALPVLKRQVREALGWVPDWDVCLKTGDFPITEELVS